MGKKDKNKKRGKGAEKTAAKTEKKEVNKLKKNLVKIGEDDVEKIIADLEREELKKLEIKILKVDSPRRRVNFSFVSHPDKDELILFGGEYFNGQKTFIYNDLFFYNIQHNCGLWLDRRVDLHHEPSGKGPLPRSSCCMVPLNDGKILIYGGYTKEKLKKDVDKGHVFTDAFLLVPEKNDTTGTKWKWVQTKVGGIVVTQRSGMTMVLSPNNLAYAFGGVFDVEDEEDISSTFFNDLYLMDLSNMLWKM
ncbi:hypothetical protein FQR65_LT03588 [Abscondita terminalis]|nr:hypothetical protein FQR65_LT03588 [Abscondita terminalis]